MFNAKRTVTILLIAFLAMSTQAEPWNITRLGGVTTDIFNNVKTLDDIAYCATDFGLVLMDVSDKENPTVLRRIETNGTGRGIEIRDSLLYFCDGSAGLKIYSLSEPTEPIRIGECREASGASRVILRDDYAYVSCGGMAIIDIADPTTPEEEGRIRGECDGIALLDDYAYLGGGQIRIVDIEDPTNPEFLAWSEYPYTGEMSIYNEILCGRLIFYSLENREEPERILRADSYGMTSHQLIDGVLFLPIGIQEMRALTISGYDLTDPTSPERLVSCVINTLYPNDLDFEQDYFYTTHGYLGFTICDFRDWENTEERGTYANYADFHNVVIQDDFAYAHDFFGRLVVISLEDTEQPEEIFEETWDDFQNRCYEMPLVVNEGYLYSYQWFTYDEEDERNIDRRGIYTYSLENPAEPELVSHIDVQEIRDMQISGEFLYSSPHQWGGLIVISLENPASPELIEIYEEEYRGNFKLDIKDNLLITCSEERRGFNGIVIWDKSDPFNIEKIVECDLDESFRDVAIYENYAYLTGPGGSLWIMDLEDLEHPEIIGEIEMLSNFTDLEEKDGVLYASTYYSGIFALTLEDAANPELIGYYDTPAGNSWNLAVSDNLLCLADGSDFGVYDISRVQGLWYLDLSAESHYFDSTFVDSTTDWDLTLSNVSGREREISEILFTDLTFSCLVETPFDIPAESDTTITVTFAPLLDSLYSSTLSIVGGESDLEVALSGRGYLSSSVKENAPVPFEFFLSNAYPNPFNATTVLNYRIPHRARLNLSIFDISGRLVQTLIDGEIEAGQHSLVFRGDRLTSGIYLLEARFATEVETRKLVFVK